ncbi:hypothetical protein ACWATR_36830 [Nostoc sp. UIC 10890]
MLLIILQLTEGYINGVAAIGKKKVVGKFWFGVATAQEVKTA